MLQEVTGWGTKKLKVSVMILGPGFLLQGIGSLGIIQVKRIGLLSQIGKSFASPSQPNCVVSPTSEPAQSDPGVKMETHLRCDMIEVIEKHTKEKVKRADHNNSFPNREKSSSKPHFQKGKGPSRGLQSRKNQAETGGHKAVKQKGPSEWRAVNSNLFGSSTPLKFGTDFAEISTIGMEFKGFQAGSSNEANLALVDQKFQVGPDKLKEDYCTEGSEMALDTAVEMG